MTLAINGARPVIEANSHVSWPHITVDDETALREVLRSGDLAGSEADAVLRFQEDLARFIGVQADQCVGVSSGTAALYLALVAAGVQPGDEVITSAYSFSATAHAIQRAEAKPVFCDIDATGNIDPAQIAARIRPSTTALLPVDIHGVPADMGPISRLAAQHSLLVISDAAQSVGARYAGRNVGTLGDVTAFSLNKSKCLPGGEGGVLVTENEMTMLAARRAATFGEDTPALRAGETRSFWSRGMGDQQRLTPLAAALARSQLPRLPGYLTTARLNANILTTGLADLPGVLPPVVPADREPTWWKYMLRVDADELGWKGSTRELRDRLIWALRAEGVIAGVWQHHPLPALPAFRQSRPRPWAPAADLDPLEPWHPEEYPETVSRLASGIVLGSEVHPLYVQPPDIMHSYLDAMDRVIAGFGHVADADYEPLTVVPPFPPNARP